MTGSLLKRLSSPVIFLFLLCLAQPAFSAPSTDGANASSDDGTAVQPIQVHGDHVEYFHEQEKVVGTGHVHIDYEGGSLNADKITLYMNTKIAVAEGNVVLKQGSNVYKGPRGEYNYGTKTGTVTGMDAFIPPSLYGKAKTIEKVSENHYRAHDSYITTCCGDSPFYRVEAHDVDIYSGDKVVVRNAVIYVKNVPIFFVPYYVQPLTNFSRFPVELVPGTDSRWGPFLLSKLRYQIADRPDFKDRMDFLADYRVKRGFGGGVDNYYTSRALGRGVLRVYYADDQKPPETASSDRYRAQWRHQMKLTPDTTLTTEINKESDKDVIKDFFYRQEYEQNVVPDNYVSLITNKPEYTFAALERARVNDFDTVLERDPQLRFDTHTRQFADTPFYLREEYQFDNLRLMPSNSSEEQDTTRFDTNHTLLYNMQVGALNVTPRVGTRQTYYSRGIDERDMIRSTFDPGLDASIRFYRTYNVEVDALGLHYHGIRHIFAPTASYNYRPNPSVLRTELQQFDELDTIDKQNFIRYSFENKFQARQEVGKNHALEVREIGRIVPFFDTDFDSGHLENVGIQYEASPWTWLGFSGDATYNSRTGKFDTADEDIGVDLGPNFRVTAGERYVQDSSSQTTVQLDWKINSIWSAKLYDRYEFETNDSREFELTLSRTFNCVIADFTYNHKQDQGDSFFVQLYLKGFPKASIGLKQSYNSPRTMPGPTQYNL